MTERTRSDQSRYDRFNIACDRCLSLIDDQATTENFQTAFPSLKPEILKEAGHSFVSQLKKSIKREKDTLLTKYEVHEMLNELEILVQEAGNRSKSETDLNDVWRPDIDLSTAMYSRSTPLQQQRIELLEQELRQVEAENVNLALQLEHTMQSEESLRTDANESLQRLEQTIRGLETTPELTLKIRDTINHLLEELGPRAMSLKPP